MHGPTAAELITHLNLIRHPEGGWYRETYRASGVIPGDLHPERFAGDRAFSTAIYFMLQQGDISALHRIKADEMWHFYAGASMTVHLITPQGEYRHLKLGSNIAAGETFQGVVPAGCWFGAEVPAKEGYSLVGCTVAPGFDFADFEMGRRDHLLQQFPDHSGIISLLTHQHGHGQ